MRSWCTALGLTLALACSAQAAPRPVLRINQVDASSPPQLFLLVTDLDSSLKPITDRKAKSYRLAVDGVPQVEAKKVAPFHTLGKPLALVLVIQVSPPMRDVFTEAVDATRRLVESLPKGSKVGLMAYTDVVLHAVKPGPAAELKEAIDELRIREDALEVNLPNAIKDALESLDNAKLPRRRLVVLFSDGLTAELNYAVFSELGRRAKDKGVVVHSVGYAPLEPAKLRTLHELSKAGGGTTREARDAAEVRQAFAALQEEIRNQLWLTYSLAKTFDGKLHDFQVETPGGQISNIVAVKLARYTPKTTKRSWFKNPLFLIILIGVGQIGVVLLVLGVLRWRRRGARRVAEQRGRYLAAVQDEEDEEEEEETEEEEDEEEEKDEESEGEGKRERGSGGRSEPIRRSATARGRAATDESSQRLRMQLLEPDPDLFHSTPNLGAVQQEEPDVDDLRDTAPKLPRRSTEPQGGPVAGAVAGAVESDAAPPPPGEGEPDPAGSLLLPDPEQFIQQAGGQDRPAPGPPRPQAPSSPPPPSAPVQPGPDTSEGAIPHPDDFLRKVGANIAQTPPPTGPRAGTPAPSAISGTGIPMPQRAPLVGTVGLPAEAGVRAGQFLDRKTKVMAVEDMESLDYVAWVVPLDSVRPGEVHQPTTVTDGFVLGEPPLRGLFTLDAGGFRLETVGSRGETLSQLLADNDHFFIGDREFVFKIATRTTAPPVAAVRLEVLDGMDEGRNVALPEGEAITIGAHPGCDLVVRGKGVEQRHAIAYRQGRVCTLSDLGTPNGIVYQGQRVGYQAIHPTEEVLFGEVRVVYTFTDLDRQPVEYRDDELLSTKVST